MPSMSAHAVSAYIQAMIERNGLTPAQVQDKAGVRQNYLWKLANGKIQQPKAETIDALVKAVRGNLAVALSLLLDPSATADDGYRQAWDESTGALDGLSPEQARWWLGLSPARRAQLVEALQNLNSGDR